MSRKLVALNLALAALTALTAWRIWDTLRQAEERRKAILGRPLPPVETAPPRVSGPPKPLIAADYLPVAEKLLFSPDRNPEIVIEAAQPKPMPPLPVAHGVLDLGAGPTVILSESADGPQRGYRVGEQFGEFVIAEIAPDYIVFQWEGQLVRRSLEELQPAADEAAPQVAATKPSAPAKTKPKSAVLGEAAKPGPSDIDIGGGIRACKPGDTSPPGTVVGGYKKVVTKTPFGNVCRWEPVG